MSLLKLTECSFSWDRSRHPPLFSRVSFSLEPGRWSLLRGPSGSGKSTLALMCAGLLRPTAGAITFDGHPRPSRRMVQFLFQDPFAAMDPLMTVGQWFEHVVGVKGLAGSRRRSAGTDGSAERVGTLFTRLGLSAEILGARPLELSGGECQRVNLAAALIAAPAILILDEPFTMLDGEARTLMLNLLRQETSEHTAAVLLVHHGLLPDAIPVDQVLELSAGGVVARYPDDNRTSTERVGIAP